MSIPVLGDPWSEADPDGAWASLDAEQKHERILRAAWRLFSEEGLDAPMPKVASLAGAGVGSLYRQFPSKRDLLAAIVTRRLEQIHEAALTATRQPGGRWEALTDMLWMIVERQHGDTILGQAWPLVEDDAGVETIASQTRDALEELLAAARAEGHIRMDASVDDIRLIFSATRSTQYISPDAWRRMLELLIDGLATRPQAASAHDRASLT
jgi:AcrR family transcriptional regulator